MKKLPAVLALLLLTPASVWAQSGESPSRGQGYAFIGPLVSDSFGLERGGATAGFGGEMFIHRGLGAGMEFAWAGPHWTFDRNGLGIGSVDASYHFFGHGRAEPFVVGGYSLYFGDRTATQSGYNLGGGLNLWLSKHAGVRLGIRYQGNIRGFSPGFDHYVAFRFGLAFR